MQICEEHDGEEIAYEGDSWGSGKSKCPACTHIKEKEEDIKDLEDQIAELKLSNN